MLFIGVQCLQKTIDQNKTGYICSDPSQLPSILEHWQSNPKKLKEIKICKNMCIENRLQAQQTMGDLTGIIRYGKEINSTNSAIPTVPELGI